MSESATSENSRTRAPRGQVTDIYRALRDRICLLRYPPGMLLGEHELAEEFTVSRTPVRQALQRLEYDGLTETRNGVGTMVTGVDPNAFRDIYAFRLRLSEMMGEFPAEEEVPHALSTILALQDRLGALKGQRDMEAFWQLNHELHHTTNRLIANLALRETHERYYFQASRIWYSVIEAFFEEQLADLASELNEIVGALRAGDIRAVGYIQRNHIAFGLHRVASAHTAV
ncbi:GntR family transcriptional regulator [Ancylobacter sp. TS-1]|uniref:GntR family transcriptional regulator n=1 Tax=Ancylobacter sp. TS-1 TaxID=1850374 RepID=UPI001265B945|nr:GntR family transcriptional regulator [Ancylobacter sp. TS-1]QFR34658.1 GntR family transcriptional regulator [Ancylobacter sp. TS-1]